MTNVTQDWESRRTELAEELVPLLYREGMFRTWFRDRPEGWELVSGTWSPFYISMRDVPSRPALFRTVVRCAAELLRNEAPQATRLLGLAATGVPLAAAVALTEDIPMSFNRKIPNVRSLEDLEREVLKYGGHALIEGEFSPGDRVALMDDVVALFDSKEVAIRQLQMEMLRRGIEDVEVSIVLTLFDRGRDTASRAAAAGVSAKSLVTLRDGGLDLLRGIASDTEIDVIGDFINNYERYQDLEVQENLKRLAGDHRR